MRNAIQIDHLSKQYRLGVIGYGSLIDDFQSLLARFKGTPDPNSRLIDDYRERQRHPSLQWGEHFWALKDISLKIQEGEMLGVIGRNGAGKSTLLKILSRITAPTSGQIKIKGRVTSLLEVGTGFHPDLTGRENIFLNGTLLGMTRSEVKKKFDEIVDFSEIGPFIDTPVKRYSSGMYVRLAFGVAANLEPEILIVDEVLAVGDVQFQKKCIGKMNEVTSKHGRTVLFVTHNIGAVQNLCTRAILLKNGEVVADGNTRQVIDQYLNGDTQVPGERLWDNPQTAPGYDHSVKLRAVRVCDTNGKIKTVFDVKEPVVLEGEYIVTEKKHVNDVHFYLRNENTQTICVAMKSQTFKPNPEPDLPGHYKVRCTIPANLLNEGLIRVEYMLSTHPSTRYCNAYLDAIAFNVVDDRAPTGARGQWEREWPPAFVRPTFEWSEEKLSN